MKVANLKQKMTAENPFFGKSELLALYSQIHKMESDIVNRSNLNSLLSRAWNASKTDEDKALFWVIVFSSGDIANRDHNLFRRMKVAPEGGGNSARNVFYWSSVWALTNSKETETAWYSFLDLIPEYTNWENLFYNGIRTDRRKGTLIEERFLPVKIKMIAKYLAKVISNPKTPDVTHQLLAKFLDKPRTSARQKKVIVNEKNIKSLTKKLEKDLTIGQVLTFKRELKDHTKKVMAFKAELATELSNLLNWEVIKYPKNVRFVGLEKYKAQWNRTTEAYLFSSKEILKMDEMQFLAWLDTLPSGARYRVQCRVLDKNDKKQLVANGRWKNEKGDLGTWFLNWLKSKEVAQAQVRNLTEDQKKEMAPEKLKELTKAAKVNTGASTFIDILVDFFKGGDELTLNTKAHSILDKINIQVPVLVIADVSGSMSGVYADYQGTRISAMQMAQMATTLFLLKNPNEDLSSFFIRFDSVAEVVVDGTIGVERPNKFMSGHKVQIAQLIDRKKDFMANYKNICRQIFARNSTNFTAVSTELKRWVDSEPQFRDQRIEIINQYPVWLVISDGDMNNGYNAAASMTQFKMQMKQYFGWDGIVVVWDVKNGTETGKNKFENIENIIYYGGFNPSILHQIFCNLHDIDIIDVYTPLVSMFRSQRYAAVRDRVLGLQEPVTTTESITEMKVEKKSETKKKVQKAK